MRHEKTMVKKMNSQRQNDFWNGLIMKIVFSFFAASSLFFISGFAAEINGGKANPSEVRIIPVSPTPESDNVETTIVFPKRMELIYQTPFETQIRLDGYPLGTSSDFDRKKQIYDDPSGQSMRIFVDNYPPLDIYDSFVDSLDQNNLFYNLTLNKSIHYDLSSGTHVLRAFPVRSYGESLKGPGSFSARIFYVGSRKNNSELNLQKPYLTYNEPLESVSYDERLPILLDFYLSNIQLSKDGYKVRINIDDTVKRRIIAWTPYYIYGLKKGSHTIRLQLLDEKQTCPRVVK